MSTRRDNESPVGHHNRPSGSNGAMPVFAGMSLPMPPAPPQPPVGMVGHMPPVVMAPPSATLPAPGMLHPGARYAPSDHVSPEVTQPPNPLQQLMNQHQQEAQHFLRNFLHNSQPSHHGQQQQQHQHQQHRPPPMSAPPMHLMTPIQPAAYHTRPMMNMPPPPMPQTMQLPMPPSSAPPSIVTSLPRATSSHGSSVPSTPRQASGPPPGKRISGDNFEYHVGEAQQSSGQLEVMPVTIYASQRRSPWGNMIAVNELFISYPIRNGLIRLLHQSSGERLLLREHENHAIDDIACFGPRSDLLLSAGSDGKIVIYRIRTEPLSHEIVKVIHTPAQRVIWHPFDSTKIAVVTESTVFITDLNAVSASSDGPTDMQHVSVRCSQTTSQINDVVFSPCGRFLVTGGMDGFVHIYRIDGCSVGSSAELLHRFEPFDGGEVWLVRFFGGMDGLSPGLLVGGDSNSKLSLWEAPLTEGVQPTCVQTIKIVNEDGESAADAAAYDVEFDSSAQFLFVTDRTRPLLFVLHLASRAPSDAIRRFDNITEFNVTYPVLSGAIINRISTREATAETGLSMQLFTVQTHAIQRYSVNADRCYAPLEFEGEEEEEDEAEDMERADGEDSRHESASQSVGAQTTEGESEATSFQAPAESPRATAASPETELDVQTPQQNGDDEVEYTSVQSSANASPPLSPRRTFFTGGVPHIHTMHDDASSLPGEDAAGGSMRSYARSSPSSSVRAFRDDMSQLGEMSIDESVAGSDHILAFLRRMEAAQTQREERSRENIQKMMVALGAQITAQASAQVEKTIQKQIQTILVPAMGRIVLHTMENNFMKPVQAGFERAIAERLIPDMEAKINASLESTLPDQLENGVSDMVERVVEDVRQPVRESFRECFRDIIIPSFQAATQKMFEQIHDHVLKGAASSAAAGREAAASAEISSQLTQLVGLVDGLSRKVDQLQANGVSGNGHVEADDEMDPEEQQLLAHKARVLALIGERDFEEAFKYALGAQNVGLVAFTCQQCDARDVLSSRPPQLSQMIILCLVQQLGADIANDLPVKIVWLREALLVMNPRDVSIVGFVGSVLQELQASLDLVPEADRDSQYTLVHHILKSLLSSV